MLARPFAGDDVAILIVGGHVKCFMEGRCKLRSHVDKKGVNAVSGVLLKLLTSLHFTTSKFTGCLGPRVFCVPMATGKLGRGAHVMLDMSLHCVVVCGLFRAMNFQARQRRSLCCNALFPCSPCDCLIGSVALSRLPPATLAAAVHVTLWLQLCCLLVHLRHLTSWGPS